MNIAISCRMGIMILIEKLVHCKMKFIMIIVFTMTGYRKNPIIRITIFILKIRRNVCGVEKLPTFIIMLESISIL